MSSRPPQNYPKILIDKVNVIKPCVTRDYTASSFVDQPKPEWKKIISDTYKDGLPSLFKYINSLTLSEDSNQYLIRFIKYIALIIMQIHSMCLLIYGYFYPYSLSPLDTVSDEFLRCYNWSKSIIRAFAWHPAFNRCAVAICNDFVYIYEDANRIRVLRHNKQRNIMELAWHPTNREVLVVATQDHILIWSIQDGPDITNAMKDAMMVTTLKTLAPGGINSSMRNRLKINDSVQSNGDTSTTSVIGPKNVIILDKVLPAPIVSMQFDKETHKLYCCSPNSSRIVVLNIDAIISCGGMSNDKDRENQISYIGRFGSAFTRISWSPKSNRLATSTTASTLRIYEPYSWSFKRWVTAGGLVQDIAWSKPSGTMLLVALKDEPIVYALPFLDEPLPNDVGGNKSLMKAIDLTETKNEFGETIGGRIQSLVWDKDGRRLAISFKDNPNSVLLYRTIEKPTVEFHQLGVIQGENGSSALLMAFHDKYKNGSLLTICWSDGQCQHLPLAFTPQELAKNSSSSRINASGILNNTGNISSASIQNNSMNNTPSKGARSLTSFCHVAGNNSISLAYSPLLMRQKCLTRIQGNLNISQSIHEG